MRQLQLAAVATMLVASVLGILYADLFFPVVFAGTMKSNPLAYTSGGTAESDPFCPKTGHIRVSGFVECEDDVTWKVQRKNYLGEWNDLTSVVTNTTSTEDWVVLDGPLSCLRFVVVNTDASAGSCRIEWIEGGEK